jgi:hypothetical protein
MDGKNATLLTPEDATHEIGLSDSGEYFVDSYSTPADPPVAVLRDATGQLILTLEKADISKLMATAGSRRRLSPSRREIRKRTSTV